MMLPWRGFVRGTQTTNRVSSSCARSRTVSRSGRPPSVSLATTRIVLKAGSFRGSRGGRLLVRGGPRGLRHFGPALEDPVDGARDAVLVRPAHDRRDGVEVEDRRRGRELPLEGQR